MEFQRKKLEQYGFEGFKSIKYLKLEGYNDIPSEPGIYIILRESASQVDFLSQSVGGFFKGKNPTVPISELKTNWVSDSNLIYIGKAGGGRSKATLKSRLKQYIEFGKGKNIGHYGGRYIWQLNDSDSLLVAWKPLPNNEPEEVEMDLINKFREEYGKRPFANLKI